MELDYNVQGTQGLTVTGSQDSGILLSFENTKWLMINIDKTTAESVINNKQTL